MVDSDVVTETRNHSKLNNSSTAQIGGYETMIQEWEAPVKNVVGIFVGYIQGIIASRDEKRHR